MSSSPQFTPAQVLNAARRAEAEGKLDYAAQFYRHIVDYYAASPEAHDARDGLGRLEWRRKEPPGRPWPATSAPMQAPSLNGSSGTPRPAFGPHGPREEHGYPSLRGDPGVMPGVGAPARLAQVVVSEPPTGTEPEPVEELPEIGGYRTGRFMAGVIAVLGWTALLGGGLLLALAFTTAPLGLAAPVLGLRLGVLAGLALIVGGVVLVLAGHLAYAVFDNAGAVRRLLAIEKAKALM
jgi:hypothetical protein